MTTAVPPPEEARARRTRKAAGPGPSHCLRLLGKELVPVGHSRVRAGDELGVLDDSVASIHAAAMHHDYRHAPLDAELARLRRRRRPGRHPVLPPSCPGNHEVRTATVAPSRTVTCRRRTTSAGPAMSRCAATACGTGTSPASVTRAPSPVVTGPREASAIRNGPPVARSAGGRGAVTTVPTPGRAVTNPRACSPVRDLRGGCDGDAELRGDLAARRQHVAVGEPSGGDLATVVLDDLHVGRVPVQHHPPIVASC
jgi:hypothetical protein